MLEFAVACLCVILILPPLLLFMLRRPFDPLHPVGLFCFFAFCGYVLPLRSFLDGQDVFSKSWAPRYDDVDRSVVLALWTAGLGIVGFLAGYAGSRFWVKSPRAGTADPHRPQMEMVWRPRPFFYLAFFYTTLGLTLFSIGVVKVGGFGALLAGMGNRIQMFEGLNYFFMAINLLLVVSLVWWGSILIRKKKRNWWFWLYTAFAVCCASLQGTKATLFVFAFTLLTMNHLMGRRISMTLAVSVGAVLVFLSSIYVLFFREYMVVGELMTVDVRGNLRESLSESVMGEYMTNFMQLQILTLLVDQIPSSMPYQSGASFLSFFTIVVPHALWPDKPLPSPGILAVHFWPQMWYDHGTTMPPGIIGELYMNFAWWGVFLGMVVFGGIYGVGRRRVEEQPWNPVRALYYSLFLALMLHYLRGESVAPSMLFCVLGIPAWVLQKFAWSKQPRPVEALPAPEPSSP
jgi:oligosaccharide repeat unit polymerase